jgi:hypothetical protein
MNRRIIGIVLVAAFAGLAGTAMLATCSAAQNPLSATPIPSRRRSIRR